MCAFLGPEGEHEPSEELVCSFSVVYEDEIEVRVDEDGEEEGLELWAMDVERLLTPPPVSSALPISSPGQAVLTFSTKVRIPS